MTNSNNLNSITAMLVSVLLASCATLAFANEPRHQTPIEAHYASAQESFDNYNRCLRSEALKRVYYSATAVEVADAAIAVCDKHLVLWVDELANAFDLELKEIKGLNPLERMKHLDTMKASGKIKMIKIRDDARGLIVADVLDKRARKNNK